jgi:hypothetical protein
MKGCKIAYNHYTDSLSFTVYQRAAIAVGVAYVSLQLAVYFELPTIV